MEVMPVVNTTPTKRSQNSSSEVNSRDEWISSFLLKAALRPRLRSLPVVWMIIVSVVVFPIGWWSQLDSVSKADEANAASSDQNQQAAVQSAQVNADGSANTAAPDAPADATVLPSFPSPTLSLPQISVPGLSSATRSVSLKIIVSGRIFQRTVELAEDATVAQAIDAFGLPFSSLDRVYPAADAKVYNGLSIRITRVRAEIKSRTVSVAPEVRYRPTAALRPGQSKVENAGQTGLVEVSERVWFKDGKVTLRENLGKETVRQPQDKVVAVGARPFYMPGRIPYHNRYARAYTLAARAGSPRDRQVSHETKSYRRVRSVVLTATGYSPHPSENGGYTVTATGLPISYGAAAVDPRVIPLGTKLYVEGYGYAFASDVGGAIKGKRIDLAYDSYRVANSKGRKKVRVWILAP
jgi:3D (Asp-Asp-Asp) domain-containing protein